MLKFIKIIVICLLMYLNLYSISNAVNVYETGISVAKVDINVQKYKSDPLHSNDRMNEIIGRILGVIRNFGIVLSVILLSLIGFKTMIGSVNEKSEYKQSILTFIIGVIVLFSCTVIPDIIYRAFIN